MIPADPRALLRRLFDTALAAADPALLLEPHLPDRPRGRCVVVGGGKASAAMARALDRLWPDVPIEGAVAVPHGTGSGGAGRIALIEAAHPRPDEASERAGRHMLSLLRGLRREDLVLALLSGGGSSLLCVPAPGLSLADTQAVGDALLRCGAPITEINLVRRHLSALKDGRLAEAAAPARVVTLLVSDIPGDRPADIASGPTIAGSGTAADALSVLRRYRIDLPDAVRAALEAPRRARTAGAAPEIRMLATPAMALAAAADAAGRAGIAPLLLGDALEGESRVLGRVMAGIARSVLDHAVPVAPPCVLLSGGECTVTLGGSPPGRGGRNTEASLGFALAAPPGCWSLMADTDGIDGNADAAGAFATPDTLARAAGLGLDPRAMLEAHDSAALFEPLGDLLRTGPTGTNVNDFRAVLIPGPARNVLP